MRQRRSRWGDSFMDVVTEWWSDVGLVVCCGQARGMYVSAISPLGVFARRRHLGQHLMELNTTSCAFDWAANTLSPCPASGRFSSLMDLL